MKREFLKHLDLGEGARLPEAAIDAIMAEHGKTVNPLQETISTWPGSGPYFWQRSLPFDLQFSAERRIMISGN